MPIITAIESKIEIMIQTFIRELKNELIYDGRLTISDFPFIFHVELALPFSQFITVSYGKEASRLRADFKMLIKRKEKFLWLNNLEYLFFTEIITYYINQLRTEITKEDFRRIVRQRPEEEIISCVNIYNVIRLPKNSCAILDDPKFDCTLFLL